MVNKVNKQALQRVHGTSAQLDEGPGYASPEATRACKLSITGRVQGVFYRAHAQESAVQLGLTGYVKNMPDDSVEALVQGSEENIKSFIEWCQEGSPSSKVDQIKITWQPQDKHFETFLVL